MSALLILTLTHANSAAAISAPTATVSLSPQAVLQGGPTTVSVTLTNPNAAPLTGVADTTTMPTGITPVAIIGTTCGGAQSINGVNGGVASMLGGTLAANGSCSFSFSVTAAPPGVYSIPTGSPSASGTLAGIAGPPVTLTVNEPFGPSTTITLSPSSIYSGGTTTFTATVTNPNNVPLTGVNDTVYPAPGTSFLVALGTASCNNGASVGVLSVSAGAYSANFSMTANSVCMFTGTLTSTNPGSYSIAPGEPIASGSLPGAAGPPATLTVNPLLPPTATIVVAPTSIAAGGQALATTTLTNPNSVPLSGVGDSVTPPSGTSFVANLQSGTCNGTQSVDANAFTLSNATLAANASCTIAYLITSSTAGTYPVASGTTSATGANVSAPGPTTPLIVKPILAPIVTVSLSPTSIPSGGQSLATVTFKNPNSVALAGIGNSSYPPLFTSFVASVTGGTCNGTSSVTASMFQLSGATLAANASCTITYPVTSTTIGTFAISTGTPTIGATYGVQGAPAYLNVMIAQTITFQSSAPVSNMVGGFYTPVVSASSGLPVTITIDAQSSGICSMASGVVTFNAPGNCILDANQGGNSTFTPASQVQQSMNVQGPPIEVTIYDQSYFVAYGKNADYTVIVVNLGATASNGVVVSTLVSAGLDGAAAQWSCIAAVGGAVCPSSGTGLLSAMVNLPAGSGLEWQWVVPVTPTGTVQTVTASVSATGALSEQDVDTVVLFRDGLD